MKYWDKRIEIFGADRAFLPLTLDGALKDDVDGVLLGFGRCNDAMVDDNGRRILFVDPSLLDHDKYSRFTICRAFWYVLHAILEDETTQKRGIVFCGYAHKAKFANIDRPLMKMNMESIKGCIPVRVGSFHLCRPPSFFKVVFPIMKVLMGARLRARVKVYFGDNGSILEKLAKFGIRKSSIPSELGGNIVLDQELWVEDRKAAGL